MLRRKAPGTKFPRSLPRKSPPKTHRRPQPNEEEGGTIDWDRVEEMVTDLTERIEAMGPVNLDAIQEYDELEQRQIFLEQQNADLVNSKAELHAVIAKINRTTKELFADTFARIRENFQIMFSELFGGGHANLMLVDEADPLESGIEIIAKPPGKQLQSVSLALRRRTHDDRRLPSLRHLHGQAQPVLRAGRNGRPARRIEHQPVYQNPGSVRRTRASSSSSPTTSARSAAPTCSTA